MNILVFKGSPKPVSDTMTVTNAFLKGLNESGEHNVEILDIAKLDIKPCKGCFGCWANGNGKCVQNDDQNMILEKIVNSDINIWSFPLYCYGMPSHLKAVVDRLIPLIKLDMHQTNDGGVAHDSDTDFSRMHNVVICGAGFPGWEDNFAGIRLQCRNCFGALTMICVPETPLMASPAARPLTEPLLARFTEAGREYINGFELSEETVRALETPMAPAEDYIGWVNSREL